MTWKNEIHSPMSGGCKSGSTTASLSFARIFITMQHSTDFSREGSRRVATKASTSKRTSTAAAKKEDAAKKELAQLQREKEQATDPSKLDEIENKMGKAESKVQAAQTAQAKTADKKSVAKAEDAEFAARVAALQDREKISFHEARARVEDADRRAAEKEKAPEGPKDAAPGTVEPNEAPVSEFLVRGDEVQINGEWVGIDQAERSAEALREAAAQAGRNRAQAFAAGQ